MSASVRQGDIFWCVEAGKKPVLVLTRNSAIHFLDSLMVAPLTRALLEVPSFVNLGNVAELGNVAVNLDAIQTVEKKNLQGFIATLSKEQMLGVREAVQFAMGFDDVDEE
jgi:mRNA-degrading endonuclease toxin of MazEF toxin-antitoxin module